VKRSEAGDLVGATALGDFTDIIEVAAIG